MKKILLVLIVPFLAFNCKAQKEEKQGIEITKDEVKTIVTYLASDELKGRNTGTDGIDAAADYIQKELKSYGVKPYFDGFLDEFTFKGRAEDSITGYNVVGYLEGNDEKLKNEFVVIGAHYDHIGFGKKVENDSIANGANDNATGTATVMSIAKYLADKKNNKRSVIFALFSAEEMGLRGSAHLAKKLKNQDIDLYTMINFEMLGVPFKERDYEVFLTGYDKSNFASKFNEYQGSNLIGFSEVSKQYSLFRRSDNYAFFQEFNVPSHTISSCDLTNFDHYHKVGDEADKMDYPFMADVINKTIVGLEKVINSSSKEIVLTNE
ncbi:peptidase M28-like protein [Winogradskyella wandonensis]|uniref:Peptidase M28-like protein n=1 Tax=Winogradskyella wandonensis TaxID=1442586 RepID=A0A4R1KTM1_9FLAO|nr:M20/M25/M40 family metallo-hydrolase [Winogradskyella wandonensis]TCK68512.1 peptidase M28-like protein [Winogradskyella wandonensis]